MGKIIKYVSLVLAETGFPQQGPTPLYENNHAAIAMVNENRPMARAHHIDIQHFVIQEWTEQRIVQLDHIPGKANHSNALTKALCRGKSMVDFR